MFNGGSNSSATNALEVEEFELSPKIKTTNTKTVTPESSPDSILDPTTWNLKDPPENLKLLNTFIKTKFPITNGDPTSFGVIANNINDVTTNGIFKTFKLNYFIRAFGNADDERVFRSVVKSYSKILKTGESIRINEYIPKVRNGIASIISIMFFENLFEPSYQKLRELVKDGKIMKIKFVDFKNSLAGAQLDNATEKELFRIFLGIFGTEISKVKAENAKVETQKSTKFYNSPLSTKYQIPDITNQIYNNISPQKLKTLFIECKQMLLVEYNESRSKRNKKDKTIFDTKVINIDNNMIELDATDIPQNFHTDDFYITQNKQDYYMIKPNKVENNKIFGTIYTDLQKINLSKGQLATIADTFGAKYDLQATPTEKRKSTFLDKLKKTGDIVGVTGDNNIFKTAAGDTVTALAGHSKSIYNTWTKDFPSDEAVSLKQVKSGLDAHIRYTILLMFRNYLQSKIGLVHIKSKIMKDIIPVLADHIAQYDAFVKWLFESTNYIISEYINDNPDLPRTSTLLNKYINDRGFFSGQYRTMSQDVNKTMDNPATAGVNKNENPKAGEIVGIKDVKVTPDFLSYCVATKIAKP